MDTSLKMEQKQIKIVDSNNSEKITPEILMQGLGAEICDNHRFLNIKNPERGSYKIILHDVKNCTNAQDGQIMILYKDLESGKVFVREKEEFYKKFVKSI